MKRKAILISILALVLSLFVGAVSAQENEDTATNRPERRHDLLDNVVSVVTEATGLSPQEIMEQLRDGSTLTQVIENAGGDAGAVLADVQAEVNSRIEELFTTEFDFPAPGDRIRDRVQDGVMGEVATAISDATGLELADIMQQLRDGAILADIITENGGDVDVVITTVVDSVTSAINERVDNGNITEEQGNTILENLEETVTNWINGDAPLPNRNRPGRDNRGSGD